MYILWSYIVMGLVSLGNLVSWMLSHRHLCGSCWLRFHKTHVFKILCALLLFNIMFESFLIWKKNALVSVVF